MFRLVLLCSRSKVRCQTWQYGWYELCKWTIPSMSDNREIARRHSASHCGCCACQKTMRLVVASQLSHKCLDSAASIPRIHVCRQTKGQSGRHAQSGGWTTNSDPTSAQLCWLHVLPRDAGTRPLYERVPQMKSASCCAMSCGILCYASSIVSLHFMLRPVYSTKHLRAPVKNRANLPLCISLRPLHPGLMAYESRRALNRRRQYQ